MVAPRALVFRPLVKGNKDSGNEIVIDQITSSEMQLKLTSLGFFFHVDSVISSFLIIYSFDISISKCFYRATAVCINNGNRTEWSPIRSVIIRVINKIRRPRSGSPIC